MSRVAPLTLPTQMLPDRSSAMSVTEASDTPCRGPIARTRFCRSTCASPRSVPTNDLAVAQMERRHDVARQAVGRREPPIGPGGAASRTRAEWAGSFRQTRPPAGG